MRGPGAGLGLCLIVVMASIALVHEPAMARDASTEAARRADVRAAVGPGVTVTWNRATRVPAALSGTTARPVATARSLGWPTTPRAAAEAFLSRHGDLFGVAATRRAFTVTDVSPDGDRTFVRFQQAYRGLPVLAGELIVQVGPRHQIVSVNGRVSPGLDLAVRPSIGAAKARRLAVAATARRERVERASLRASAPTLAIYDPAVAGDPRLRPGGRLAWHTVVRSERAPIREWVAVDATSGAVLALFNQVERAIPSTATQRVCDLNGTRATAGDACDPGDATLVADPARSTVPDVVRTFKSAQSTHDFLAKRFGRNGLNGKGMTIVSTVRYCPGLGDCPYLNATWNGSQAFFGSGWGRADDIVAHELIHGLTQYTSKLFYWYQSGAISESMSDVLGELIDQSNGLGTDTAAVKWLLGEDLTGGAGRDMRNPGASPWGRQPDRMRSPDFLGAGAGDSGGVHTNSGVGNKAAYLITQGGSFNGQSVKGLGIDKAAALYYRVLTRLLASGSDYNDLGAALRQACKDLVGTTPKNRKGSASGSGPFSALDCSQVEKAVRATEMGLDSLVSTIQHTRLCKAGSPSPGPFLSKVTASGSPWVFGGTSDVWVVDPTWATSKPYSLWGRTGGTNVDAWARSPMITIPATGTTFLAFRNYVELDMQGEGPHEHGGVVEYATDPGGPWKDLGSAFVFNGYNGTLTGFSVLSDRDAFVGFSHGFGVSKADLTFLAGKSVTIRFRVATPPDGGVFSNGWQIDDVRVYQCT